MMFLQGAFHLSLYLFAASIAAAPSPNPDFDDSHLPSLRLPREEVQAMKESQTYPPGYIHQYVTLGEGSDAVTVPIVEADLNVLLDNEDGARARSLATRDQKCNMFSAAGSNCLINYCWTGTDGVVYSEWLSVLPGKKPASSNPKTVSTSNINNLYLSDTYNTGYNHWFPNGHECSNSDTQMYTKHRLADGVVGDAYVDGLQCDTCFFSSLECLSDFTGNNLVAFTGGTAVPIHCVQN
jgi:hypothetical protein